jgi:hypothetical protein
MPVAANINRSLPVDERPWMRPNFMGVAMTPCFVIVGVRMAATSFMRMGMTIAFVRVGIFAVGVIHAEVSM